MSGKVSGKEGSVKGAFYSAPSPFRSETGTGFPCLVSIGGVLHEVRWDFVSCMEIIAMLEDGSLTDGEKAVLVVDMLFVDPPSDIRGALDGAFWFLGCGEPSVKGGGSRLYSLTKDYKYIYTGIYRRYGVEPSAELHWWKFCRMVTDLDEDCLFYKLIDLRKRKKLGKLSKEEAKVLASLDGEQGAAEDSMAKSDFFERLAKD